MKALRNHLQRMIPNMTNQKETITTMMVNILEVAIIKI